MTTAPKIFLTLSITAFALSFTTAGSDLGWGILKPLSAVMFIAFFITHVFAKDMALHDEEERRNRERTQQAKGFSRRALTSRPAATILKPAGAK